MAATSSIRRSNGCATTAARRIWAPLPGCSNMPLDNESRDRQ